MEVILDLELGKLGSSLIFFTNQTLFLDRSLNFIAKFGCRFLPMHLLLYVSIPTNMFIVFFVCFFD